MKEEEGGEGETLGPVRKGGGKEHQLREKLREVGMKPPSHSEKSETIE